MDRPGLVEDLEDLRQRGLFVSAFHRAELTRETRRGGFEDLPLRVALLRLAAGTVIGLRGPYGTAWPVAAIVAEFIQTLDTSTSQSTHDVRQFKLRNALAQEAPEQKRVADRVVAVDLPHALLPLFPRFLRQRRRGFGRCPAADAGGALRRRPRLHP